MATIWSSAWSLPDPVLWARGNVAAAKGVGAIAIRIIEPYTLTESTVPTSKHRLLKIVVAAGAFAAGVSPASDFPEWAYPSCAALKARSTSDQARPVSVPVPPRALSPDKKACGYCHLPDGNGRPENAKLAGLPASYIIAQVRAFRAQQRKAAQPGWLPTRLMVDATTDVTDEAIASAADYFSRQPAKSFVRVIEQSRVPAHVVSCFIFAASPGSELSLGSTIVELPVDDARFERRDPHATYIAFVPRGSIERGRRLALTGDQGRTQPCATCHGPALKGGKDSPGPALAGRFPTYLFRQLYAFQTGARREDAAQPMQSVVAQLTQQDMIDLAAYAASEAP